MQEEPDDPQDPMRSCAGAREAHYAAEEQAAEGSPEIRSGGKESGARVIRPGRLGHHHQLPFDPVDLAGVNGSAPIT